MEGLIRGQLDLYEQLRKADRNFKKANREQKAKSSYLVARLEALTKLEEAFSGNHLEIVSKATKEQKTELPYFKEDLQDGFQELFIEHKSILKEHLDVIPTHTTGKAFSNTDVSQTASSSEVQLPRIQLPQFSGKYNEWQSFYDMFVSLIHKNALLSPVQKLHYLKSTLSGEPEILLRNFPTTENNYTEAWGLLKKRYNNKRYNCNLIMKTLFGQKPITNESANTIRQLLDTTTSCLKSLNNLGVDVDNWDVIIIHLVVTKLDHESHRLWENHASTISDDLPTWTQLKEFLETRFRTLEMLDTNKQPAKNDKVNTYTNKSKQFAKSFHATIKEEKKPSEVNCLLCDGPHSIYNCTKFKELPVIERQKIVQTKRLCFNCLASTHPVSKCYSGGCRKCGRKHHTSLHFEHEDRRAYNESKQNDQSKQEKTRSSNESANTTSSEQNLIVNFARGDLQHYVLLATAVVNAKSKNGNNYMLRALLDQGSQASFITEESAQLLGLSRTNINGRVSGMGDGHMRTKYMVTLELKSRHSDKIISIRAYVLSNLTSLIPSRDVLTPDWLELKTLPLADPGFATPGKVDILIGADAYGEVLLTGVKKSPHENMIAQNTVFGWILSGRVTDENINEDIISLHVQVSDDDALKKFWEMENEPNSIEKRLTEEEEQCERYYESTTVRRDDGRFVVRLPLKTEDPQCQYGQSRNIAMRKLQFLERRLSKDPTLYKEYNNVLNEYTTLNHMRQIETENIQNPNAVYLPHHAVVRNDKDTTKVRVVFNASSKGVNGVSLNDDLLKGPKLQQDLRHLLLRWRQHPICIVADLVKMYRQVYVNEQDAEFQRIIWRTTTESPIQHYKLLTLTFGTACAPYLAVKTLQKLAEMDQDKYPIAAEITKRDYYVDDLMTGCETENEAIQIYEEMNGLMSAGGFELQKWSSNNGFLLRYIAKEKCNTDKTVPIKVDNTMKVLGISWNRETDNFEYCVNLPEPTVPLTKRQILSDIARLYDPIGWIAPVVITAKIIIQKLWKANLDWDEELVGELLSEWLKYREELVQIQNIWISRWIGVTKETKIELHAFSDASSVAFAAAIYVKVSDESNNIQVNLITAKTKVAPIEKEVSIPRLELCGAALAAKLINEVGQVMGVPKENWFAWTDSTVVLAWLRGPASRWATYVSNRVSNILTVLNFEQWGHVSTNTNPADCASRGLRPMELQHHTIWWKGPKWLSEPNQQKPQAAIPDTHEEEKIKSYVVVNEQDSDHVWIKFSDLTKMLRIISYCRRFLNLKLPKEQRKTYPSFITTEEMNKTLTVCIKQVQEREFNEEINHLKTRGYVAKRSAIYTLYPFLDKNGVLRVGGRLREADVSYDQKHPIIMPAKNHFSMLLVKDSHNKTLHGGPQLMMNVIRLKYWILRARNLVKQQYRNCVTCRRYSREVSTQLMGQLPESRLTPGKAFKASGLDYAGPINIRFSPGRGAKSYKGYICLFVCMSTRAVHLEAVTDLTSKGFIAAFKRFTARRGHCQDLYSDNGTNFVGADKMLRDMFNNAKSELPNEIAHLLSTESTKWHFIPPSAPNFGGLWEASVRCTKAHLKRVIGDSTLTYEELSTLLAQIEACLNSRPISTLSDNPDDPLPLTPGHFLIGEPMLNVCDIDCTDKNVTGLDRWKMIQKMLNCFWNRWYKEYLCNLNQRTKWCVKKPNVDIGDVVVVRDDNIPPAKWIIGIITDTHAGPDNLTRVVTIKHKGGFFRRPINKICVLTKS